MIISFLHYFLGYLTVEINGEFCERLLNLISLNKVSAWNIKRKVDKILLSVKVKDIWKLRKIRRKTGIKVRIIERKGVPFIIQKYHLRYGFVFGLILFFSIIYILNMFVWRVEIVGNQSVSSEEIFKTCEAIGIKNGIKKSKFDSYKLRDELLLNAEKLSWASLNLEGSVITVNVSEIKNDFNSEEYCNIISDYNGVIKSIKVQKGSASVSVGDAIQKGDLLISGVVTAAGQSFFTNASGEILAEVEEKITIEIPMFETQKTHNVKNYKKYCLDFFNITIPLYLGRETRDYDYIWNKNTINFFGKEMPIVLYTLDIYPYIYEEYQLNETQLEDKTNEELQNALKEIEEKDIKIINVTNKMDEFFCTTTYTIKYLKNIGIKEKILF